MCCVVVVAASELTTSKTKRFCKISCKNGKLRAKLSIGADAKKWGHVKQSLAPVAQNHLSKPEDLENSALTS